MAYKAQFREQSRSWFLTAPSFPDSTKTALIAQSVNERSARSCCCLVYLPVTGNAMPVDHKLFLWKQGVRSSRAKTLFFLAAFNDLRFHKDSFSIEPGVDIDVCSRYNHADSMLERLLTLYPQDSSALVLSLTAVVCRPACIATAYVYDQ